MKLLWKQLSMELFKNKPFLILLLILTAFTSSMYFFVHFSVDGNIRQLTLLTLLSDSQINYKNSLISNTILARAILTALTGLTCFVFAMFFYRFFKTGSKQLACLKSLGFKDRILCRFFMVFTASLSFLGALIGLIFGYFASDILIQAGVQTYLVTGLVKGVGTGTVAVGFFVPMTAFCVITFFTYYLIRGKEIGLLLTGAANNRCPISLLRFAGKISELFPVKKKLPIRLTLRKPMALFLVILSVMSFSVMFILGYSLTLSSQRIFKSQTEGHHYLYETRFDTARRISSQKGDPAAGIRMDETDEILPYLDAEGSLNVTMENGITDKVVGNPSCIETMFTGIETNHELLSLVDKEGNLVELPKQGEIVIGFYLQELYDLQLGSSVTVSIGKHSRNMTVSGIAFNASSGRSYVNKSELSELLSLPKDSYSGIFSMKNQFSDGTVITKEEKTESLKRDSVSNRSSAVINQLIGCLTGCILLYLALLLNFQDSTRDILILHLMGYPIKEIKKMLIDIYRPVLWLSFFLTLLPGIQIVKMILKSLSLQIGDFLAFQTNVFVLMGIFVLLNGVYFLVQSTFHFGIKKIIRKETIADYTM